MNICQWHSSSASTLYLQLWWTIPPTPLSRWSYNYQSWNIMTIRFWSNFCLMLSPQAAYSFYNVSTATPWVDLMGDALVIKIENILLSFWSLLPLTIECFLFRCLPRKRTLMSSMPSISWRTGKLVKTARILWSLHLLWILSLRHLSSRYFFKWISGEVEVWHWRWKPAVSIHENKI